MNTINIVCFFVLSQIFSCAVRPMNPEYNVVVSDKFTKEQFNIIVEAANVWVDAVPNVTFHFYQASWPEQGDVPKDGFITVVHNDGTDVPNPSDVSFNLYSGRMYPGYGSSINILDSGFDSSDIVHEFGHALSLVHSNNINDVMYPYYTRNTAVPSCNDVKQYCKIWGYVTGQCQCS